MKNLTIEQWQAVREEAESLQGRRPLAEFIDGITEGVTQAVADISRGPLEREFPCALCVGAGFLIHTGRVSVPLADGTLQPLTNAGGSEIVFPDKITCPRCLGMQYDVVALCEANMSKAQEGAA